MSIPLKFNHIMADYKGRGYFNNKLQNKLQDQQHLFSAVMNDPELDLRVRENQIHIYYKGGKLLNISDSPKPRITDFNCNYTCRKNKIAHYDELPKCEREKRLKAEASERRERMKSAIAEAYSHPHDYIVTAKQIMDGWFDLNPQQRWHDRHQIALANRNFTPNNDLVVLDTEFIVSRYSNCYNKQYIEAEYARLGKKEGAKPVRYPRFDLVAVDAQGQVYVIELKTGCGSAGDAVRHFYDFAHLAGSAGRGDLGDEIRWVSFLNEVKQILHVLQRHFRYPDNLSVDTSKRPVFSFADTDKGTDYAKSEKNRKVFVRKVSSIRKEAGYPEMHGIILVDSPDYYLQKSNLLK